MSKRVPLLAALVACYVLISGVLFLAGGWKILLLFVAVIGGVKLLWRFSWFRKGVRMQSPRTVMQTAREWEYQAALQQIVDNSPDVSARKIADAALKGVNRKNFEKQVLES